MDQDPTMHDNSSSNLDRLAGLLENAHSATAIENQRQRDAILGLANDVRSNDSTLKALGTEFGGADAENRRQRDLLIELTNSVRSNEAAVRVMAVRLEAMNKEASERGKTNWPTIVSLALMLPTLSAILIYVITSQIEKATTPISQQLASVTVQQKSGTEQLNRMSETSSVSTVADTTSRTDRAQLNERLRWLETSTTGDTATRRGQLAEITARLASIEQSFHSVSNVDNLRWSQQARENAIVYEKINPGSRYPMEAFFPSTPSQATSMQPLER